MHLGSLGSYFFKEPLCHFPGIQLVRPQQPERLHRLEMAIEREYIVGFDVYFL